MDFNSPKRFAIFIPSMQGHGAERVMLNLAVGVAAKGYSVDLVLARAEGPFMAEVPETVRVVDLKASRVLASLPALVRYLRQNQPQAMLSAMGYVNIIALWARRLAKVRTRVIVSEHNTLSSSVHNSSSWRGRMMPHLIKRYYPMANGIITVSKGVADDLAQMTGIPGEYIQVIYNPVVTPELQEKAHASLEHPWFGPDKPPVLLAIGRLTAQKDFSTLIHAFAQVRRSCSARLLILGDGEDRYMLEDLVRRFGLEQDVSLSGWVENPYAYMAQASLFVLSSRWEGLPTVLIEAMSCGMILIATDCPSGPREILNNGQYGQLVPVGNVNTLAHAIIKALAGKIQRPPSESYKPFKLDIVVSQYINVLLES